jgi:hypothetical protein
LGGFNPKRVNLLLPLAFSMLGTDVFSLVSGVVGLVAIAVSLWHWLSPHRRLRALDITMNQALQMLASMQEEHVILDRMIVVRAHEQLYRCSNLRSMLWVTLLTHTAPVHVIRPRVSDPSS